MSHRAESSRGTASHRARSSRVVRAYVGLGANLGDAAGTVASGVLAMAALPQVRLAGVSRLYRTAPWGVLDQPAFHNAVVALDVRRPGAPGSDAMEGASELLVALKSLERRFGRRERERWGPRELDLDLLLYGRAHFSIERPPGGRSTDPAKAAMPLTVPHPEAANRLFVLAPLADLAPGLVPPGWHETVETARRRREAEEGAEAAVPAARWSGNGWSPLAPEATRAHGPIGADDQASPR